MCPKVQVYVPPVATTGSLLTVLTFVATKPRPLPEAITVKVVNSEPGDMPVVANADIYPAPSGSNNYTFVHTIHVPEQTTAERDRLLVSVNMSRIPHDRSRCGGVDIQQLRTKLIQGELRVREREREGGHTGCVWACLVLP